MRPGRTLGERKTSIIAGATLTVAVILLTGCDSLLDIEAPSRLPADEIAEPQNAEVLVEGAVANFECALANYVVASGEIGDELVLRARTRGGRPGYDRRDYDAENPYYSELPCRSEGVSTYNDNIGVYTPIQTARQSADEALAAIDTFESERVANKSQLIAKAAAYSGYSHLLLGEGFCTAAVDLGPRLSRAEVFQLAVEKFNRAVEAANSADNDQVLNMARVGLARAKLNMAQYDAASNDASAVPGGFVMNAQYSGTAERTENRVYTENLRDLTNSVGPMYHNVTYEGEEDPRVPVYNTGQQSGAAVRDTVWGQRLYSNAGSPIPIATWEEAQLIVAEARLRNDNISGFEEIINQLHRNVGLSDQYSASSAEDAMEHLIQERRRELFLDGHHLQDIIRLNLPLIPPPGSTYEGGGTYGDMTCMPLPEVEIANNPNIDS